MQKETLLEKIEHIYIHLPFCKNKCSYCDFISFEKHEDFISKYHTALCNELKEFKYGTTGRTAGGAIKNTLRSPKFKLKTLYIGGGTPSLYPLNFLEDLFKILRENFDLSDAEEITIEVNPGDVTEEHLKKYRSLAINRLSIGVQLLDEKALSKLNRYQKNKDVIELLNFAPKYFENISVDLILGLPYATEKTWFETLNYITSQKVTHISIYFLTIYDKTPIYFKVQNQEIELPSEDEILDLYEKTIEFLTKNTPTGRTADGVRTKFEQYEISNFAQPVFESKHNQAYWDRKPYKGFGLSASSFHNEKRFTNTNNLCRYINFWLNPSEQEKPEAVESITQKKAFVETVMLGLRQKKGLDLHRVLYFLSNIEKSNFLRKLNDLEKNKFIVKKNGKISLTSRGVVLESEIVLNLL